MRNLFFVFIISALCVSCLNGKDFSSSYTTQVTFDFNDTYFTKDSLVFDNEYKVGLGWEYMSFYHKIDAVSSEFKGGFLVSWLTTPESGITSELPFNQYRANVRIPNVYKNKYAVFTESVDMPETHMSFMTKPYAGVVATCTMRSVFVTNTVAVEDAVRAAFVPGDQLVVKATGYVSGQQTSTAEIKLAEFTTSKDSVVTAWTLWDLSALGTVDKVMFDVIVPAGKDVPAAFCMDNMLANIALESE